ncbi:unnamed protein product [Protopolystoma xenopodis]|uniref:Uncharacterized protein n=1 Tax=Protopolystoma xenopodis TaxID=117903 RepID=A0A448X969_9PLAT|nr:unnamed protein product [Protopolystoma xenopodis]
MTSMPVASLVAVGMTSDLTPAQSSAASNSPDGDTGGEETGKAENNRQSHRNSQAPEQNHGSASVWCGARGRCHRRQMTGFASLSLRHTRGRASTASIKNPAQWTILVCVGFVDN